MANRLTVKDCALVCQNLEVCGNLTVQGTHTTLNTTVTATTTAVTDNFVLESSDAGSSTGPDFRLFRSSASPAASDNIGQIMFDGKDSAGNVQAYGAIFTKLADPTSGSEDSTLYLNTYLAGAEKNVVIAGGNLGIGTTSTSHPLTIKSTQGDKGISLQDSSNREIFQVRFEGGNSSAILFCNHGSSSITTLITGRTNNNSYFNTGGNLGVGITASTSRLHVVGSCAQGCTFKFADTSGRTLQDLGSGVLSWNAASVFGSASWAGTGDFEIVSGWLVDMPYKLTDLQEQNILYGLLVELLQEPLLLGFIIVIMLLELILLLYRRYQRMMQSLLLLEQTRLLFGGGDTDFIVRTVSNAPRVGIGTATPNCILDMYVNSTTNICFGNQNCF